jgi:hypothetical protein
VPDEIKLNYPDILGYITGGQRFNVSVVQAALAVRPRVVRAGRPFEVILVVQNASDADIDVTATLSIPDADAAKKKGRFITKAGRLVVGLKEAEAGYVTLPVSCLPDTAISSDYKINVDIKVAPASKGKPQRVRATDGGAEVDVSRLSAESATKLDELKQLSYTTTPRSRLGGQNLEVGFSVMSGSLGTIADLKPGWVSLWTLNDHQDDRLLLHRFREAMQDKVLPKLKRARMFPMILTATTARFEKAGYPLQPIEAQLVAKVLTLILEYASPSDITGHSVLAAGEYNLLPLLDKERLADPRPITLPHWSRALLRTLVNEPRAADYPIETITRLLIDDLLLDAMLFSFKTIEANTGEELGTEQEMEEYARGTLEMFEGDARMDFTHAYMPLVLGGCIIFDTVIMPNEKLDELVQETKSIVEEREHERNADNELVFTIAHRLVDRAVSKYGYRTLD